MRGSFHWRPFVLVAVVGLAGLVGCGEANEYVPPPPPPVTVSPPTQRPVTEYLEFTGRTVAVNVINVRARVRGFLQKAYFEEGQTVEEGAPLFLIDQSDYNAQVDRATAGVNVAKATLDLAQATLDRMEEAVKTNAVSVLDVIEARAKRDGAKAQVAFAQAALESAQLDLSYTEIKAPMAGRVGEIVVDLGNLVGAGENTLLTTIVQLDPMQADFDVSERELLELMGATKKTEKTDDIERIRAVKLDLGTSIEDEYPHAGSLFYIAQNVDAETGTLLMRGQFPNPVPRALVPGLFVKIRAVKRQRESALLVAEEALGTDQGGRYVLVVDAQNVVHQRRVEIGALQDGMRVIEDGLEPNDLVVVLGVLRARPGAKVTPQRGESTPPQAGG